MTEAVIVLAFFVMTFLAVLYFRALYVQKLHVQRLARAAALGHAMGACQGDPQASIAPDLGRRRLGKGSAASVPFDGVSSTGGDKGSEGLRNVRAKKSDTGLVDVTTVTVRGGAAVVSKPDPAKPEQGFRGEASSASFVVCGDPTPDDRYEGMVDQITSLF